MAGGLIADKNYNEDWIQKLPNKRAQTVILDFLYNGALVFRDQLVAVDGWRCILPQPLNEVGPPYNLPERRARIDKRLPQLVGPETNSDAYFKRVGMKPVNKPGATPGVTE